MNFGAVVDGTTDDSGAWQDAIDYLAANGGGIITSSRPGVSVIACAMSTQGGRTGQLHLPQVHYLDEECIFIGIVGAASPTASLAVGNGDAPVPTTSLVLKSTVNAAGAVITGGNNAGGSILNFTNVHFYGRGFTVRTPANPTQRGLDLEKVAACDLDDVTADTGSYDTHAVTEPTHADSVGIHLPDNFNQAHVKAGRLDVTAFYTGFRFSEHAQTEHLAAWACKYAFAPREVIHGSVHKRLVAHHCTYVLDPGGVHCLDVQQLNVEHSSLTDWRETIADINDPNDWLRGRVRWHAIQANVGVTDDFTINGARRLKIESNDRAAADYAVRVRYATATVNGAAYTAIDGTGAFDLKLQANVGDLVEVTVAGQWGNQATYGALDVASIVAGNPVNSWARDAAAWGGTTPTLPGCTTEGGAVHQFHGGIARAITANDLVDGIVTLRRRLSADTGDPRSTDEPDLGC